jgi:hypothetical protein
MNKRLAWSYSALDMFHNCPKKFYHLRVAKTHKEPDSEWQADGKFIHDALYKYACKGTPLPPQLRHMQEQVDKLLKIPGERHGEMKMCLNEDFKPRGFFAKDAWCRAVVDLVILPRPVTAVIIDWKTGKQKEGFDQLELSAVVLSRLMPEIEEFHLIYAWLKDGVETRTKITRRELKQVWLKFLPRVQDVDNANATTSFPAKPSGLCGFCCITECPNWYERD